MRMDIAAVQYRAGVAHVETTLLFFCTFLMIRFSAQPFSLPKFLFFPPVVWNLPINIYIKKK